MADDSFVAAAAAQYLDEIDLFGRKQTHAREIESQFKQIEH